MPEQMAFDAEAAYDLQLSRQVAAFKLIGRSAKETSGEMFVDGEVRTVAWTRYPPSNGRIVLWAQAPDGPAGKFKVFKNVDPDNKSDLRISLEHVIQRGFTTCNVLTRTLSCKANVRPYTARKNSRGSRYGTVQAVNLRFIFEILENVKGPPATWRMGEAHTQFDVLVLGF
jgi:hypothetical protein